MTSMPFTQSVFDKLTETYGKYASWAIWNPVNQADVQIISENLQLLQTSVILVGLNVSGQLRMPWQNFHGGKHDRKLMFALNDSPYRGAYMTDIIKGEEEVNSNVLRKRIKNGDIDLHWHISLFRTEMLDLGVHNNSLFILLHKFAKELFTNHLAVFYPNCVYCRHYSSPGTDAAWVQEFWDTLEKHCRATRTAFNTLKFVRNRSMKDQLQRLKAKQT